MKTSLLYVFWGISLVLLLIIYAFFRFSSYPELDALINQDYSLEIYDRNEILLKVTALEGGLRRTYRKLEDIPGVVKRVFILAEDSRFYFHPGIDPLAVFREYFQNRSAGRIISGASTISMQLARIVSGSNGGYKSKFIEMSNALRLESRLSKNQILELWLNNIPFSFQVEGVSAASLKFLGRDISLLDEDSSLILAVIPRSPANLNPLINKKAAIEAAAELGLKIKGLTNNLERTIDQYNVFHWPDLTPHFSLFVEKQISTDSGKYGKINTSIDSSLNILLEDRINYYLSFSTANRITTGAGIIINNKSGEIFSYVGSANFNDIQNSGQIDGVQILNQPGSTLKPFLYALAIEMGFLPNSVLPDIPQHFGSSEVYQPMNFDQTFHGPVLLRVALASSMNVPAVYMINSLGVQKFADYLIDLGFESLKFQRDSVGTGLALGNAEVSLMELTRAYSVFSRDGHFLQLTPFLAPYLAPFLESSLSSFNPAINESNHSVMKPYTAGIIRDILTDNNSRYPGFGDGSIMDTSFEAMFKTGTSNQFQNIWALGSTPEYTVGVWMGDFSGNTVIGRTGSSLPAAIVVEMLDIIHTEGLKYNKVPESKELRLCTLSGLIPNAYTPSTYIEILPENAKIEISNWHKPDPERSNIVMTVYPEEYSSWLAVKNRLGSVISETDEHKIMYPANNSVFFIDPAVPPSDQILKIKTIGFSGKSALVLINGRERGETNNGIYNS